MTDTDLFTPRMLPNKTDKMHWGRTLVLSFAFFTVLLAWSYFNFKVPLLLDEIIPDMSGKDTIIGVIMAIDNFLAIILQPWFGSLSDRTQSRFGRRIPYITLGTLFSAFFFVVIPLMQTIAGIVAIIFLFDLFMSIFRAISIAILPDYTPDSVRSKASGIQQFIANFGGAIGFIIPTLIGMFHGLSPLLERLLGFIFCAILMVLLLLLQILFIKETPTGKGWWMIGPHAFDIDPVTFRIQERPSNDQKKDAYGYRLILDIFQSDSSMVYMIITVVFLYLGFASVEAFFSRFALQYMEVSTEGAAGNLLLAYSIPMILTAPLHGLVGQKIGRKRALRFYLIWQILGVAVFAFLLVPHSYKDYSTLYVMLNLAFISIPWMGVIVHSFPIIWALAPEGKIGSYMGVYYFFNQAAYTLSPILMGVLLDVFAFWGSYRFIVMFPYVFLCLVIAFGFFFGVKRGDVSNIPPLVP